MRPWYSILILTICLVSCQAFRFPRADSTAEPSVAVTIAPGVTGTATPTSAPVKAISPTPTPVTPSPTALDPTCVTARISATPVVPAGGISPDTILGWLNQGVTARELDQALYAAGVASQPVSVMAGDMTGDGRDDLVIALIDPDGEGVIPPGELSIFVCKGGRYELAHNQISVEGGGAPHLWYLQDLQGDGQTELVVSWPSCGAHTCFEMVELFAWDGVAFENHLEGETGDLPYPDVRVDDPDRDEIYDLILAAGGIGSVGAGPQRGVERVWTYRPQAARWEVAADNPLPSNYRVHILADGEAAAKRGDFEAALLLYQRVIHDAMLEDWVDPVREREDLAAYARFRSMVVLALMGEQELAEKAYEELVAAIPEAAPQYTFIEMGQAFWEAVKTGGAAAGCAASRDYAAAHVAEVLEPLGPGRFGYANPEYRPEDVCDWPR